MKTFTLAVTVVLVIVSCTFAAIAADPEDVANSKEAENSTAIAVETTEAPLMKTPSQCLYDFRHKRVNIDCHVEKPPKCEKGSLVQTMNGEDHEMCCCNYSNFVHK